MRLSRLSALALPAILTVAHLLPAVELAPLVESGETPPLPVNGARLTGEWSGISEDGGLLVTLRVGARSEPTTLAVSERRGAEIVSMVYTALTVQSDGGTIVIRDELGRAQLHLTAWRYPETGWGRGTLSYRDGALRKSRRVYFFFVNAGSWLDRTLRLRAAARN